MNIYGSFDGSGCGVYRVQMPLAAMKVMSDKDHQVKLQDKVLPAPNQGHDLIVINRQHVKGAMGQKAWFTQNQACGTVIVTDIDDDIWHLDKTNPVQMPDDHMVNEAKALELADLVTVTSESLAKVVRRYNGNVAIIPNHIPGVLLSSKRIANVENPKLIVGWTGSLSHIGDLQVIAPVLQRYAYEFPDTDLHSVGLDFGRLLDIPNVRHTGWDADIWGYYRNLDFDIGLAPLAYTKFNRSKSYLKAIEYMALGIPVIATDIEPYRAVVQHGVTGFLCRERRHWMTALRRLTTDEVLRKKMSNAAREAAKEHTFEVGWKKWEDAYMAAVEKRKNYMQLSKGPA